MTKQLKKTKKKAVFFKTAFVTPPGFEPESSEPESDILSVELRGRKKRPGFGYTPNPSPIAIGFQPLCGGAGGIRTLVQTRNRYAFYMLSLSLIFVQHPGISTQIAALASVFLLQLRSKVATSLKLLAIRLPGRNQTSPPANRLVPSPCVGIKPIY